MVITTGSASSADRAILRKLAQRIDPSDAAGYNNLGVLYFNKGMIGEAIEAFQHARDLSPAFVVAARNLEIAYLATGEYERLVEASTQVLTSQSGDRAALLTLVKGHLAARQPRAAADLLRTVMTKWPDDLELLRELARAELEDGRVREAQRLLEGGIGNAPQDPILHYLLGESYVREGELERACQALERGVAAAPDFGDAWHLLGQLLRDGGKMARAEEALRRAAELRPELTAPEGGLSLDRNNPRRYEELVGTRAERPAATGEGFLAHYHAAVALRERGLYQEALKELALAERLGEDPQLVRQTIAELLMISGETAAAVDLYRSLLQQEENSPKLWNELGVCLHRQGRVAAAEECYRRALMIDRSYVLASNNLGVGQVDQGEMARASGYFDMAVDGSHAADALCNAGLLALRRGDRPEALRAYRAALARDADSGAAWVGVGSVLSDTNQLDDARQALARAIELRPNDAEPRYHLAFVLNRLGDLEGSLRETRTALSLDPFYAAPRFRLLVDLHYEYTEILAPDLSTSEKLRGEQRVEDFTPASEEISSIFHRMEDSGSQAPKKRADYRVARTNLKKGLLDRALEEAGSAARQGADPVEGALITGEIFRAQGLFGEALERFDSALARIEHGRWGDQHAAAWLGRGWCLLSLGHPDAAAEAASMVQSRDPSAIEPRRLLAEAKLASGAYVEALFRFARLAELLPGNGTVLLRLGTAARAAGDVARARSAFLEALQAEPDLLAARVELGELALAEGDPAAAAEQGRLALDGLPGYTEAALLWARAQSALGRYPESVQILIDLLEGDPYHLDALLGLGEALLLNEQAEQAAVALKRALKFDRDNGFAWKLLGDANGQSGDGAAAMECWRRALEAGLDEELAEAVGDRIRAAESLPNPRA